MIGEGRVKVNGEVVLSLGHKIDWQKDEVEVDGKRVKKPQRLIYLMLNKPAGYLVSLKDPSGRPTILELIKPLNIRVFPVGRLDFESEGLLLLTNDGEFAFRATHPRYKVKKVYLVEIKGKPEPSELERLRKGIYLEGRKTAEAKIYILRASNKRSLLRVEIHEGRKREVRRMFEVLGHPVFKLRRLKFAGLDLGNLKKGKWRYLTKEEISLIKKEVGLSSC